MLEQGKRDPQNGSGRRLHLHGCQAGQGSNGGTYLAVREAIDGHLSKQGVRKKEPPKSVEGYRKALHKYAALRNHNTLREFEKLYDRLYIAGCYRGILYDRKGVKDAMKGARSFIDKIS